jgi:2-oxo-3-hexenedioate decarboxylase
MLADELIAVHENARTVAAFTDRQPGLTPAEGYRAAQALHERRLRAGWKALGRKIGFTNRTIWARYGVYEPIWGTVYDRTLTWSEGDAARVSLRGLVQPRIEPEICFGLKTAPPLTRDPARLLESIAWVAHSIEIVQCHHPDWKVKLADRCAGNGLHGHLLIGPVFRCPAATPGRKPAEDAGGPEESGRPVDRGVGANVLDSPPSRSPISSRSCRSRPARRRQRANS